MGEETDTGDYDGPTAGEDDDGRVLEWEIGLPSADDLTPLSQPLIPPELASAFSITPEPSRTMLDVHQASQNTVSLLRHHIPSSSSSASALKTFPSFGAATQDDPMFIEGDDSTAKDATAHSSRKVRRLGSVEAEEDDSALRTENSNDDHSARTLKRPRLVWTPQLHKRFVDVVAHLGIKKAVPKTIMQLMNVEGLTRENVASHLQKYRLYLKRIQGLSNEGPSSSDHLFASTPIPQSLQETPVQMPMPYAATPALIPMPVFGMAHHGPGVPLAMLPVNGQYGSESYNGFESRHPYGVFGERQRDWCSGNKFGPMVSYPHVSSNENNHSESRIY